MKKVEAIIRPDRLQSVQDALDELGISGLTVTEVVGCGAQRGYTEVYRGTRANISLQRKVKVEAVVPDASVERVLDRLQAVWTDDRLDLLHACPSTGRAAVAGVRAGSATASGWM